MKNVNISIQNLSKIEGHADLDVTVRKDRVTKVHLKFTENKRFFTEAIKGRSIDTLPQSVSRICGTCSIAHLLCCIEAIEHAYQITPSRQTEILKKLTMYGLMIRDHALHLYLFSLPDVFAKDSVLDFDQQQSSYLQDAFAIKRAGNLLSTIVAGRAVHAPYPLVGGYAHVPTADEAKECISQLRAVREKVLAIMEVYANCPVDYTRSTDFVALVGKKFDFLDGTICSTDGACVPEQWYEQHLIKKVLPYSQSVGYKFEGKTYMVGALARINLNKKGLHPETKRDARHYLNLFPSSNIFHNNLAQAIEILHSIDHGIELLESTTFTQEEPIPVKPKTCSGVGVIEAPRGMLYYHLNLLKNGTVKEGRIIVPTQQNQINMELDIKNLVQKHLHSLSKEAIASEIEKLIRAYDPCISCATHFLKIRWKEAS